jgi:rSAM-associated Gly-rich repeat protein
MASSSRRQFLKCALVTLAQAGGTVVLASASPGRGVAAEVAEAASDIQNRADELVAFRGASEIQGLVSGFVNRAFRNAVGGGGFRNGGFRNAGVGGGFRNGGFANGGGAFRNAAFRNW